ncbi:gamma-glutamyl hydrolase-like [Poecilia reticulata]|uniref:gamma-glutamyl hydrolase-like n=1 Tax=Poecilia reticulata TaxID=8081 RepID=UPI0004A4DCCC|nr:PREDICTED: gamma-glutamyl hydrolase-like [Poecilia reticulata]
MILSTTSSSLGAVTCSTKMFTLLLFISLISLPICSSADRNDEPIIGVLAQEVYPPKPNQTSYIAASYVKFVEAAGARVVPVMINKTLEEYKTLFSSINGSSRFLFQTYNTDEDLKSFYKVLSTNTDGNTEFVSTVEAYRFPVYGTQWHPEKNAFEWSRPYIPHSPSAVRTTFYTAHFFVSEARKNFHRFQSEEEESKALIYNYNPVYTGNAFEQIYFF